MQTNAETARVELCLISHTNAGKTTLARTLLGRDVGEVRDAPDTTLESERHRLLETDRGDELLLWDTPGFSDSARLYKRLSLAGNPIGWFLTQVWDRWTDNAFYLSQQAIVTARDRADVVLYLVNAAEDPPDAGYLAPELKVLALLGKPVIVLLNQTGIAEDARSEPSEVLRWRRHLESLAVVKEVIPLDAFTRCWVHEEGFFRAVAPWIREDARPGYARLVATWNQRNLERFEKSMLAVAQELLAAANTEQTPVNKGPWSFFKTLIRLGTNAPRSNTPEGRARQAIVKTITSARTETTRTLLDLHGLQGHAEHPYWGRLDSGQFDSQAPIDSVKAGLFGGILTGAASGAAADLVAGGLTLGTGALLGAILGALSAGGLAVGTNKVRGVEKHTVRLSDEMMNLLVIEEILKYIAVAHFGRGRGEWIDEEPPRFWMEVTAETVAANADALRGLWADARSGEIEEARLMPRMVDMCRRLALAVFDRLYPGAGAQSLTVQAPLA